MKIVHICISVPVTDGWSYQEDMIPKFHKMMGYDVTIITSKWTWGTNGKVTTDERQEYVNADGVKVIRLTMKGKEDFYKKFKVFPTLYNKIEEEKPDILFIHNVSYLDVTTIAKYLKNNANVIAYADNHADLSNSGTNFLSKNILHKIIWRAQVHKLIPYVKKFYGVLPARVDFLADIYGVPRSSCELLVMGADDQLVKNAESEQSIKSIRARYDIDNGDFLIVTGGKIDAWKRQTLLLMGAVKRIEDPRVKLLVFGSVDENIKPEFEELVDGNKVKYIGWIAAKDSYVYFSAADIVVFPGRHSVFWEQVVAQGVPLMVKDWPGTHHVDIGGNVIFLSEDAENEIYNALTRLLSENDCYKNMKMAALSNSRKQFWYSNIARKSIGIDSEYNE